MKCIVKLFSIILAVHFTTIYRIFLLVWIIFGIFRDIPNLLNTRLAILSHVIALFLFICHAFFTLCFGHKYNIHHFSMFIASLSMPHLFSHYFPLFSYFRILLRIPPVIFVKVNGMSFPLFYSFTFSYSVERPRFQWQ